jgi:hypothetical protein
LSELIRKKEEGGEGEGGGGGGRRDAEEIGEDLREI